MLFYWYFQDKMMMELHLEGKTIEDITNCLKCVALNPWIVQAIKSAHALGQLSKTPLSKLMFITLRKIFMQLCHMMFRESVSAEGRKRFIYLGDGKGDFCPSLKLEEGDHVMPKMDYPLCELICNEPLRMKEKVHRWSNGQEVENFLLHIIKTIIAEEIKNIDLSPVNSFNWKFSTNPVYPMKTFPENLAKVEKNRILRGSLENKVVSLWKGSIVRKSIADFVYSACLCLFSVDEKRDHCVD
ncbi:hypothetical protein GIB67_037910 [Kingdonia uniflora]|uniref:Uncharacterized protein n=1 Tax=Kingdonia uniflora TaxID=39325 RepID=A0A7J7LH85_9MAGN|nr:hypothetical protein GIB67_037910 [Kingdonia uniflora]